MDSITSGDTTLLPAGFDAAGFTTYPAICDAETGNGAAFQSLIDLINDTSNALTYEQFLTEKLANACNELGDLLQDKVNYLNTHITYFGDMKTDLLTEFLGTFMDVQIGTPPHLIPKPESSLLTKCVGVPSGVSSSESVFCPIFKF